MESIQLYNLKLNEGIIIDKVEPKYEPEIGNYVFDYDLKDALQAPLFSVCKGVIILEHKHLIGEKSTDPLSNKRVYAVFSKITNTALFKIEFEEKQYSFTSEVPAMRYTFKGMSIEATIFDQKLFDSLLFQDR